MTEQSAHQTGAGILRIGLGIMFIAHGLLKVLVFTPAGTIGFFESVGFAGFLAWPVMVGEILGGAVLLSGAYTRLTSLTLLPITLGAVFVHMGNGWVFNAPNGGWEYPAFLSLAVLAQIFLGAGAFALKLGPLPGMPAVLAR